MGGARCACTRGRTREEGSACTSNHREDSAGAGAELMTLQGMIFRDWWGKLIIFSVYVSYIFCIWGVIYFQIYSVYLIFFWYLVYFKYIPIQRWNIWLQWYTQFRFLDLSLSHFPNLSPWLQVKAPPPYSCEDKCLDLGFREFCTDETWHFSWCPLPKCRWLKNEMPRRRQDLDDLFGGAREGRTQWMKQTMS